MPLGKMTDLGQELSLSDNKRVGDLLRLLGKTKDRLETSLRQGTKKAEYESYTHCLKAVCAAIAFLDRTSEGPEQANQE